MILVLIWTKWGAQVILERLNRSFVRRHAGEVPPPFRELMDEPTYGKSVAYTLAKSRLAEVETSWETLLLTLLLFSGVLPWAYDAMVGAGEASGWRQGAFLFLVGVALSLAAWPLGWYHRFGLEARFGFNTSTLRLWLTDRLKGLCLSLVLGYPLLVLVLTLVAWAGALWWLWAWGVVLSFQLLLAALAPVAILPLFNKFTPLSEGRLRERLFDLCRKTGFAARSIQVMDGSKRSRHSNAFFTGFGRWRRIVLFDTLLGQLTEEELTAVLAHEIGHWKKRHLRKMLAWSAVSLLAGFYVVAVLSGQDWLYEAFGFRPGQPAVALLMVGLLGGTVGFWLSPAINGWSRRHEYQADAFAAEAVGDADSLIGALRKLNKSNLSNLTPHPVYSRFYFSHPTLLEREQRLKPALGSTRLDACGGRD